MCMCKCACMRVTIPGEPDIFYSQKKSESWRRGYSTVPNITFINIRGKCLPGDWKRIKSGFAGGLFGTSRLYWLEIVIRVNYYLRSKQSRRCVCFARIASKHCTYQAARRWRRDEGASVSSDSGVSRRRVLSWRGCDGGVGPQQPWRGRLRSSSRWKMVFRIGLILKFHRCIGQQRPSARASSEDGLASYHRLHVSWVYARRLRARQAQR